MFLYSAKNRYKNNVAAQYDAHRTSGWLNRLRWQSEASGVAALIAQLAGGSRILDMPCGTGRFFSTLLAKGHRVAGMDISSDMIAAARAAHPDTCRQVGFVLGDAVCMPFKDSAFDYVLCMRFFNIVPQEVRVCALSEFARIARKGIILEVRLQGRLERLMSPLRMAAIRARNLIRRHRARARGGPCDQATDAEMIARPSVSDLEEMVRHAGFRITLMRSVFWGFTLSPMRVCLIEAAGAAPCESAKGTCS